MLKQNSRVYMSILKTHITESRNQSKKLRTILNSTCFAAPHNSYIVNLNYITNFKRNEIILAFPYSDIKIPIATRKQADFKKHFLNFINEDIKND